MSKVKREKPTPVTPSPVTHNGAPMSTRPTLRVNHSSSHSSRANRITRSGKTR